MINYKISILCIFFLFLSCKKNEEKCYEKFQDLYLKRYSLWMVFDRTGINSNSNFSSEDYKKLKKQLNDSLQITIDCALENDKKNELFYLYKMKQLYLADTLYEVKPFLKTVDRDIVKDDIYFQLSLFNLLCQELYLKQQPTQEYIKLLNSYSPTLNPIYKDRAIQEFLNYLINNNTEEFKTKLKAKYPSSNSILFENDRERIIKDIMMRGDMLIFD